MVALREGKAAARSMREPTRLSRDFTKPRGNALIRRAMEGERRSRLGLTGWVAAAATVVSLTFAGPAMADDCPNAEYRQGASKHLPDCRAYEQVSEVDKNGGGMGAGSPAFDNGYWVTRDGEVAWYGADGVFAGQTYLSQTAPYYAQRTDTNWLSKGAGWMGSRPGGNFFHVKTQMPDPVNLPYEGDRAVHFSDRDPRTNEIVGNSFWLADYGTGEVFRMSFGSLVSTAPYLRLVTNATGDAKYENVFFMAPDAFVPEVADAVANNGLVLSMGVLYHWSEETGLSLASWSPTGTPSNGSSFVQQLAGLNFPTKHDVSEDGQTYFFRGDAFSPAYGLFRGQVGVQQSINVMASENPGNPNPGTGTFWGASEDGQTAFFATTASLVTADNQAGADLYMWDGSKPVGSRLTLISQNAAAPGSSSGYGQALGTSDDGSRIYFTATQQIVPGAPADAGTKLYKWERGEGVSFIANITSNPTTSRVNSDASHLAFLSTASIDGAITGGVAQAYIYDDETGELECASCPDEPGTVGATAFEKSADAGAMNLTRHLRKNLSDNGELFFDTPTSLVPQDTNGVRDVYMYRDGEVYLMSTGRHPDDTFFADASVDGKSVFMISYEHLTPTDIDNQRDMYVARVNGGYPYTPPEPEEQCAGDDCQGQAPGGPKALEPPSGQVDGSGNVAESAPLRIAARVKVARGPVARLRLRAPKSGRVVVQGPLVRRTVVELNGPGARSVRVALKPGARRALARRGVVRTNARVVFRAGEGGSAARQVKLAFRRGGNR